jgi:type II secretory pathway pseudopilin PulG
MFLDKKYIKKNKKAFTIIEISIVLLIISAIIVGVTTGKTMIGKSRLANAKSLTQKSVINDMGDDLIAWYETSLESSFEASEIKTDGSYITVWKDSNKSTTKKNNAIAPANTGNQPILVQNVFYNSIPGLRFSGSQYLSFDGAKFTRNSYTVFVVEQRRSSQVNNYFIGGDTNYGSSKPNTKMHLGYRYNATLTQAHYYNDLDISIAPYSSPTPTIHTFFFNNSVGKKYTLNGKNSYTATPSQLKPMESFNYARIGYSGSSPSVYYIGDLAEIIMFKRSLKTEEVKAIESYLGSKYGIPIS